MTSKELKIYRHLPNAAKQEFIIDFWNRRDPTPETEKNEALLLFLHRVAYANKFFNEAGTKGWKTDRGRIIIQLGFPQDVHYFRPGINDYTVEEIQTWMYFRTPFFVVRFIKRRDGYKYEMEFNRNLITAIDYARKHSMIHDAKNIEDQITFKAKWKKNKLYIKIPVKRVVYEILNNGYVGARFVFIIDIYTGKKKIWFAKGKITNVREKAELASKDFIEVEIDLLSKIKLTKGKYYAIIVIKDINAGGHFASSYKDVIRIKVK
jgi:GWxTD domain-containing protein